MNRTKTQHSIWSYHMHKLLPLAMTLLSTLSHANVVGSDVQNFNGALTDRDYITSHSALTLPQGSFSLGLYGHLTHNSTPYLLHEDNLHEDPDTDHELRDELIGSELTLAIGLTDWWQVGLAMPFVIDHATNHSNYHGKITDSGHLGLRVETKFTMLHQEYFALGAVAGLFNHQLDNNPFLPKSKYTDYYLMLVPELRIENFHAAVNIGYKWRPQPLDDEQAQSNSSASATPIQPTGNQTLASVAASYGFINNTARVYAEVYGTRNEYEFTEDSARSPDILEALLGLRYWFNPYLSSQIGWGRELRHSISSPDSRLFAALHLTLGPSGSQTSQYRRPHKGLRVPVDARRPKTITIPSDILFGFNSSTISQRAALKELRKVAILAKRGVLERIVIEGHSCSIGTAAVNQRLSYKRAQAARSFLATNYGLPQHKIQAIGYGEDMPIADNKTPFGRKKNRRVQFKIYYKQGTPK